MKIKNMNHFLDRYDGTKALNHLLKIRDKYNFTFNIRIAKLSDQDAVLAYNHKIKDGFCGFKDEVYIDENLDTWLIGFNYED